MKRRRWTDDARGRFLDALAETGNVTAACDVAELGRSRAYMLRKEDQEFSAAWDEAEEIATDVLEAEARRRAVDGVARPLVSGGKVVKDDDGVPIILREYSDTLMTVLLKAHRPARFRDNGRVEITGKDGSPLIPEVSEIELARRAAYLIAALLRKTDPEPKDQP